MAACSLLTAPAFAQVCPITWDDALVRIDDADPPAPAGTPELSLAGMMKFIADNGIDDVAGLLEHMPDSMRKNYAFVERTRTAHPSSVQHPRLIMFGSDARFLMAVGSDPSDPDRELVDAAELSDETGRWIFRSIDMSASPPKLSADDQDCQTCHGSPARPIWGTYPDWPGMFGPRDDTLTRAQAARLNELKASAPSTDRFHHLVWEDRPYRAGYPITVPDRRYSYTNTIFNMELGAAVAAGAHKRLQASPFYEQLREALLLVSNCGYVGRSLFYYGSPAEERVRATLAALGAPGDRRDDIYRLLGVDPDNDFSLHRLSGETPDPRWNVSTDSIYGLVDLLIVAELAEEDRAVADLLLAAPDADTGFSRACFPNLLDSLRYKVYQGFTLRGEARQAAREADFDVDLLRAGQGIIDPVQGRLCRHLALKVLGGDAPGGGTGPDDPGDHDQCG